MSGFDDLHLPIRKAPAMKGRTAVYVPNHRSFGAFMISDQMRDVTAEAARDMTTAMRAASPSASPGAKEHTGLHARVKAGYVMNRNAGTFRIKGNVRVLVEIVNEAPGAALVEFGGRNIRRRRTMGRVGARFGDWHGSKGASDPG